MICPACSFTGWFGGYIGATCFGIDAPKTWKGRIVSSLITASLVSITFMALKSFCNISICRGQAFTFPTIIRVAGVGSVLSVIYSIGVNGLLKRFISSSQGSPNCHCH